MLNDLRKDEKVRCDLNHAMFAWNNGMLKNFICDDKDCDHFYSYKASKHKKVKEKKSQENKCESNM